jgi:hypothetical protein
MNEGNHRIHRERSKIQNHAIRYSFAINNQPYLGYGNRQPATVNRTTTTTT